MDQAQARALLASERARLQRLLQADTGEPETAELGDEVDDADWRDAEETGLAVDQLLRARWAALQRAEGRLAAGTDGRADRPGGGRSPARDARGGQRRGRVGVGRPSLRGARRCGHHPRGGAGQ